MFLQIQEPCLRPVNETVKRKRERDKEKGMCRLICTWLMKYAGSLYQPAFIPALGLFVFDIFSGNLDNKIEGLLIKFSKIEFLRDILYSE